jgi:CrcB protein
VSWLLVFVGSGLGGIARYGIARVLTPVALERGELPWATLLANVLACIVLGVGIGLASKESLSRPLQLLLLTGFCGGFSTFSTFALEVLVLGEEGHAGVALLYLALSLVGGGVALYLALLVSR